MQQRKILTFLRYHHTAMTKQGMAHLFPVEWKRAAGVVASVLNLD